MRLVLFSTTCLLLAAFAGTVTANHVCDEVPLATVGGSGAYGCAGTGTMTYVVGNGQVVGSACTPFVPQVVLVGQPVPGTGQAHCLPPVSVGPTPVTTPWVGFCVDAPAPGDLCLGPCQSVTYPVAYCPGWNRQTSLP